MVKKLLERYYYEGNFGVPLVTQNKALKAELKSDLPIYAQYQLMPLRNRMGTLSDTEQSGLLQITLFTPLATGTDLIDDVANAIVNHYGTEKSHVIDGINVMIMSSTASPAMPDGEGKYMQPITIEYRSELSKTNAPTQPDLPSSAQIADDISGFIEAFKLGLNSDIPIRAKITIADDISGFVDAFRLGLDSDIPEPNKITIADDILDFKTAFSAGLNSEDKP